MKRRRRRRRKASARRRGRSRSSRRYTSNPRRRRRVHRRHRRRASRRSSRSNPRRRRRRGRRARSNPSSGLNLVRSAKSALSPRGVLGNAKNGLWAAGGWAVVNFLQGVEMRFGLDRVFAAVPHPVIGKVLGYAVKVFNIAVTGGIAGMLRVKPSGRHYMNVGGVTNLGINVLNDLAGMFGPLAPVQAYLKDYVLYGQPYSTAMGGGLSDYRVQFPPGAMSDLMVPTGQDPYGDLSSMYG